MTSPRWPYYLPLNPCCEEECCEQDRCTDPCHHYSSQSDHLAYTGANLPCTGIDNCDTLTVVIQKIEEAICTILDILSSTTTTTTTVEGGTTTSTTTEEGGETTTTTTTTILTPVIAYYSEFISEMCLELAHLVTGMCSITGDSTLTEGHTYYNCDDGSLWNGEDLYYSNTTGEGSVVGVFSVFGVWTAVYTCATTTTTTTCLDCTTTTTTTIESTTTTTTTCIPEGIYSGTVTIASSYTPTIGEDIDFHNSEEEACESITVVEGEGGTFNWFDIDNYIVDEVDHWYYSGTCDIIEDGYYVVDAEIGYVLYIFEGGTIVGVDECLPTTTSTTTEEPLPDDIWLDLRYLAVDIPMDTELDYRFYIYNGTSNTYVTAVRVRNVTKESGWIFINTQPSHSGDIDYYSGKTSKFTDANENGDEYEMQFSTDGGFTWAGNIYNGTGTLPFDADL